MSKKRLFIAIDLPDVLKEALQRIQDQLKLFVREAKWVNPDGIHLTLKFLGYVEPERVPEIERSLDPIAKNFLPPVIRVQGCGFFPNARRPSVLWAGIHSGKVLPLQNKIEETMQELGFEKEERAFHPHLTLARFKNARGPLPHLIKEAEGFGDKQIGEFIAENFVLYESILRREGAQYHRIKEFSLTSQRNTDEHG